jgi:ubiquinone/menaquinone biosynthesis C-methylase UbiE
MASVGVVPATATAADAGRRPQQWEEHVMAGVKPTSYPFDADRAEEQRRLVVLGGLSERNTERVFREVGLGPGMRVLDLGSGAGDVALLVARLVGEHGSVVGVEQSAHAVAGAQRRIAQAGYDNVSIVQGDIGALDDVLDAHESSFDAVVGRAILMYLPDPVAVVRASARRLRPGGLLCFREPDMTYEWVAPRSPLWDQVRDWFLQTATRAGFNPRMAFQLPRVLRAAGLPHPELRLDAVIGQGPNAPADFWADFVCGLVPAMEKLGVATAAEVDAPTLTDRLKAETEARDGIVLCPLIVSAWTRP